MTRLDNRSHSCSRFEAEPLCWLQHSEQVAARLAQPGKFILWRPACSRMGEEQPGRGRMEKQRRGGAVRRGLHRPSHPWDRSLILPHGLLYVPTQPPLSAQALKEPSRTLRSHRLARSPTPKMLTGHLPSPSPCCPHLLASSPLQRVPAGLPGTGGTRGEGRHLGLVRGLPSLGAAGQVFLTGFLLCPDGSPQHIPGCLVTWLGTGSLHSALARDHVGSTRTP